MNKKHILIIFSLIGLVSTFLPYSKVITIGCGLNGGGSIDYHYSNLIYPLLDFFKRPTLDYFTILELLALLIVIFSLLFSPVFSFFNRNRTAMILSSITTSLLVISFYNLNDDLGFGYYIVVIQQLTLLFVIILSKNKILHLQKL